MTLEDIALLRKRLLYRSWHRGTREMDLILGRFAEWLLPSADAESLRLYELMLQESDPDLYDWITDQAPPPAPLLPLVQAIQATCRA